MYPLPSGKDLKMLKGTQKRIIHVKDTHSRIFGEAYFVLRGDVGGDVTESDMVREAARLVDENLLGLYCAKQIQHTGKRKNAEPMHGGAFAGFVAGAAVCSGIIGFIVLMMQIL